MKLIGITFTDNEAGDPVPSRITVEMSQDEALLIATMIGKTNHTQRNEMMAGAGVIGSDVYDCLTGNVFNRYWDDGVTDAMRER